ncbi:NAD(P)-dependent oxidoreductase [Neorhizobium lilium]|uniref:NAD(P)-dependent oxidoreductase n=2 Tax=Neorhizobium lilium TaxID=2503024 RepID=A0A3S3RIX7_9HYPH|nr:NAD(P)-dependent oxidoreductase [Neorhizobium lilium]
MGSAMARRLSASGFTVTGWSRTRPTSEAAAEMGIAVAPDLSSLSAASDVLILALLDEEAVHAVLDALANTSIQGRLIVDTSTVSPQVLRDRAAQFNGLGASLVDAPVSGGPDMVLTGKVGLYIGGSEKDYLRFLPVAEALSDRIHHVGGLGDGAAAKLVNNMMLMGLWQSLKEALLLGKKAGLPSAKILEILSGSPAASPALKSRLPVIRGETDAVGFPVAGAIKDARVVRDLAASLDVTLPAIAASLASFEAAASAGYAQADLATMVRLVAESD